MLIAPSPWRRALVASTLLLLIVASAAVGQTLERRIVTDGLSIPWEILWGPDDHLWVTERPGRVSRIDPETGRRKQLLELPNPFGFAEIGMLGMALHPDFGRTPYVYVVDAYVRDSAMRERVVRYVYDQWRDTLWRDQAIIDSIPAGVSHGGSRLLVGSDGMLYVTIGDKGENAYDAVDHTKIYGKTLRITLDGTVPADNPWPHYPWPLSLTWTTGHRNSQGLTEGPDGRLYASEHGPHLIDDEINLLRRSGNFGWPYVQGPCDGKHHVDELRYCVDSSTVQPVHAFSPSVAPAGIDYYDHPLIDELRGSLLLTTLGLTAPEEGRMSHSLVQLRLSADGERVVEQRAVIDGEYGRLRDLCVAPDGRIFIATSNRDARYWPSYERYASDMIIELRPAADTVWVDGDTLGGASLGGAALCAGDSLTVRFGAGGRFRDGNVFRIELSDPEGTFARPLVLGATTPIGGTIDSLAGIIRIAIPESIPAGDGYALRLVATRPAGTPFTLGSGVRIGARPHPVLSDSTGRLTAPAGYAGYRWHVDDRTIEGTDSAVIVPRRSGVYRVEVIDSLGCHGLSNPVEVHVSAAPLVTLASSAVRILPQPVRDRLVVELELARHGQVEIVVNDAAGRLVARTERSEDAGTVRLELPTDALAAGVYLVEVRTPEGRWSGRIVKE